MLNINTIVIGKKTLSHLNGSNKSIPKRNKNIRMKSEEFHRRI